MTEEELRGYRKAVALLRDDDRFWEFMATHRLAEDSGEFAVDANNCAADYLEAMRGE